MCTSIKMYCIILCPSPFSSCILLFKQVMEETLQHNFLIKPFFIHSKKNTLRVKGLKRRQGEVQEDRVR